MLVLRYILFLSLFAFVFFLASCGPGPVEVSSNEPSSVGSVQGVPSVPTITDAPIESEAIFSAIDFFPIQFEDISYVLGTGEDEITVTFRGKQRVDGKEVYDVFQNHVSDYFQIIEGSGDII